MKVRALVMFEGRSSVHSEMKPEVRAYGPLGFVVTVNWALLKKMLAPAAGSQCTCSWHCFTNGICGFP